MKETAAFSPAAALGSRSHENEMTAGEAAAIAARLYRDAPPLARTLACWRPYICPFGTIVALVPEGSRIFDIGCGSGLFLGLLAATGRIESGLGVDVRGAAIETAHTMSRQLPDGHHIEFQQRAAEASWPNERFNVVSFIDVMHHLPRGVQQDVFARAAGCIQSGGIMIYKDIAPVPRWRALSNTLHDLVMAQEFPHYTAAAKIEDWGRENGLSLVTRQRINMLWYGHDLAVFQRLRA
jgi:2-polyprenyl-3-methyl-5-hydroxy-6-metoxy-1,4-benzoquinol methylase